MHNNAALVIHTIKQSNITVSIAGGSGVGGLVDKFGGRGESEEGGGGGEAGEDGGEGEGFLGECRKCRGGRGEEGGEGVGEPMVIGDTERARKSSL